ncbi:unnamed protein product, partial [Prorocentrum cordatum]
GTAEGASPPRGACRAARRSCAASAAWARSGWAQHGADRGSRLRASNALCSVAATRCTSTSGRRWHPCAQAERRARRPKREACLVPLHLMSSHQPAQMLTAHRLFGLEAGRGQQDGDLRGWPMLKVSSYLAPESRQLSRRLLVQSHPPSTTDLLAVCDQDHGPSGTPNSEFQRCQLAHGGSLGSSDERPEQVWPRIDWVEGGEHTNSQSDAS